MTSSSDSKRVKWLWPRIKAAKTGNWRLVLTGKPRALRNAWRTGPTRDPSKIMRIRAFLRDVDGLHTPLDVLTNFRNGLDWAIYQQILEIYSGSMPCLSMQQKEFIENTLMNSTLGSGFEVWEMATFKGREASPLTEVYDEMLREIDYSNLLTLYYAVGLDDLVTKFGLDKELERVYLGEAFEIMNYDSYDSPSTPKTLRRLEEFLFEAILSVRISVIKGQINDFDAAKLTIILRNFSKLCQIFSPYKVRFRFHFLEQAQMNLRHVNFWEQAQMNIQHVNYFWEQAQMDVYHVNGPRRVASASFLDHNDRWDNASDDAGDMNYHTTHW